MRMGLGLGLTLGFVGGGPTPATIGSGLRGWYKGDVGLVLGSSGSWADQSGVGNNLAFSSTGATAGATLNGHATARVPSGVVGSKASFSLGGSGALTVGMVQIVNASGTNVLVASYSDGAFDDHAVGYTGTSPTGIVVHNFSANSTKGTTELLSAWKRILFTDVAAGNQLGYVNNTQETSQATAGSIANTLTFTLGPSVDLAEVVVYNTVLSSTDRALLDAYFASRYAL